MAITIKDVAREAGVSVATVSRVVNDSGPVHPDTRKRVEEIAARLKYIPSGAARSLITRETKTLGVVLPDLHGEFFSEVIRGIDGAAQAAGFHLLLSGSHNARNEIEAALAAMRGRVDGLMVMAPDPEAAAMVADLPESLPTVLLNSRVDGHRFDAITVANEQGAREMVKHVLGCGHRRIAMIKGPERNFDADERLLGYRRAMREAGIEDTSALELTGDFTEASGYASVDALLAMDPRPTAVFAANDAMAIGAMSGLVQRGIEVPEQMSVVGFDDVPLARYTSPPLCSVHVPMHDLGERATRLLLNAIAGDDRAGREREMLPTRLEVRASCGSAPETS